MAGRVVSHKAEFLTYVRRDGADGWVREGERKGTAVGKATTPVDTGGLADSLDVRRRFPAQNPTVRFHWREAHAMFPEVGTGLYGPLKRWITPRTAQALSWISSRPGGGRVFAKRVRGQRPQRYVKRTMEELFGAEHTQYFGWPGRPPKP